MQQGFILIGGLWGMLSLMLASPVLQAAQRHFNGADQAADSLVVALARADKAAMVELLGERYRDLLPIDEISPSLVDKFFDGWTKYHTLVPVDENTRVLAVGEHGWTLPIPIVREADGWRFDTQRGHEMMRERRVGRNELSAIQSALAYHDAQMEYAAVDHDGDGILEYAQRLISTDGAQDGLYWAVSEGESLSPLGPLLGDRTPGEDYHGYRYRILTAQGEHSPGGARDYIRDGNMVDGFALVAWPSEYGESGVMSFMLNRSGVLYEADLGPNGANLASSMPSFDPDSRWSPVPVGFIDSEL